MEDNINNNVFKNLFNRKSEEQYNLDDKEISESTSREKKGIMQTFSKFYEDIKVKKSSFESLPLVKKVETFLKGIDIPSKQLKSIYERIRFIINNNEKEFEEYHIHVFLNENVNVEDDKKLDLLNNFINIRCSKLLDIKNGNKFAVMCIILKNYGLAQDDEMKDLLESIMLSYNYDKIVGLYNFILDNNVIGSINANEIKKEMKSILEKISKSKTMQKVQ